MKPSNKDSIIIKTTIVTIAPPLLLIRLILAQANNVVICWQVPLPVAPLKRKENVTQQRKTGRRRWKGDEVEVAPPTASNKVCQSFPQLETSNLENFKSCLDDHTGFEGAEAWTDQLQTSKLQTSNYDWTTPNAILSLRYDIHPDDGQKSLWGEQHILYSCI